MISANIAIPQRKQMTSYVFGALLFVVITAVIYQYFPPRNHWNEIFRPAALRLLHGESPYPGINYFNPPWALIPLIPLAILPARLGNAILGTITLFAFAYVGLRLGASPVTMIMFFTLPLTLYNIIQVNIDWMMALGFIMPPQIGLFFVLLKPQLGLPLAVYWFIEAWRSGGLVKITKVFAPVTMAFMLSFILFGDYFTQASIVFNEADKTFWPASISVGLIVLLLAFRHKRPGLAISSAPLLSPYVQPYSLPIAMFGLLDDQPLAILLIIGLWLLFLDPSRGYIYQRLIIPFLN